MEVSTARAGPRGGAAASSGRGLPVLSVPPRRPGGGRVRLSPSRILSLVLCALFALIGLVSGSAALVFWRLPANAGAEVSGRAPAASSVSRASQERL